MSTETRGGLTDKTPRETWQAIADDDTEGGDE